MNVFTIKDDCISERQDKRCEWNSIFSHTLNPNGWLHCIDVQRTLLLRDGRPEDGWISVCVKWVYQSSASTLVVAVATATAPADSNFLSLSQPNKCTLFSYKWQSIVYALDWSLIRYSPFAIPYDYVSSNVDECQDERHTANATVWRYGVMRTKPEWTRNETNILLC